MEQVYSKKITTYTSQLPNNISFPHCNVSSLEDQQEITQQEPTTIARQNLQSEFPINAAKIPQINKPDSGESEKWISYCIFRIMIQTPDQKPAQS